MSSVTLNKSVSKSSVSRGNLLPCGSKTPRCAYVFPILQTLNELGGSASISEVMTVLERRMRGTLRSVDYEVFNHGNSRTEPRWRNTARWAKDAMVKLGFLRSYSPRGIWEISDFGREILHETR